MEIKESYPKECFKYFIPINKLTEILKEKGYIDRIGGTRGSWKIKK